MIDQAKATKLAAEAFEHWEAGRTEQARRLYEEAIPLADPQHFSLGQYYGAYAGVLTQLGLHEQATIQRKKSLETELAQGEPEGSSAVIVARYFLADQLLRCGDSEAALEVLSPSLIHAPSSWLTRLEEALVLDALDRKAEAKVAAELAIQYAPNPQKAEQLKQHLADVLTYTGVRSDI